MATQNYDVKNVNVVVDGYTLTGFADGSFVKVTKNEDNFTPYIGAQGEVSNAEMADETGEITVTLQCTSPSYLYMNKLAKQKRMYAVNVIDRNTGLSHGGAECRIKKPADAEFSNEVTSREFAIFVSQLKQE